VSVILLRSVEARDRPALVDLWVAAWCAAMPGLDFEARRAWFADHQDQLESAGAETILAEEPDGTPLGFLTIDAADGYLDQLVVAPAAQRRGIGRRLIAEARSISPGRLALQVNQDNPSAVRFYERQGFRKAGSGSNPRSGLPVWHMEWRSTFSDRNQE
jgi:putative acetyltransferase